MEPVPPGTQCVGDGCEEITPLNSMGLVADNVECALCHLNIFGDLAATQSNPFALHPSSLSTIFGNVFVNEPIIQPDPSDPKWGTNNDPEHILVQGAVNNVKVHHPSALNFRIYVDNPPVSFVGFNSQGIRTKVGAVGGTIKQNGNTIVDKIHTSNNGNLFLDGKTSPIQISGEVYIQGDLVIRGRVEGIGTIYVQKNIFIPDNITIDGLLAHFNEFKTNLNTTDAKAQQMISSGVGALRLAAGRNVFIGQIGRTFLAPGQSLPPDTRLTNYFYGNSQGLHQGSNHNTSYASYYTGETLVSEDDHFGNRSRTDIVDSFLLAQIGSIGFDAGSERLDVFTWLPQYISLLKPEMTFGNFSSTKVCGTKQFRVPIGAVSRIDAVLYAAQGVGGVVAGGGNFVINGGVITRRLALLGGTGWNLKGAFNKRNRTIYETHKNCPGGGTWELSSSIVNPDNGLPIHTSEIRYDYRLRNQGAGFDIMRSVDYVAALSNGGTRNIASATSFKARVIRKWNRFTSKIKGWLGMKSSEEMEAPEFKGAPPMDYYDTPKTSE